MTEPQTNGHEEMKRERERQRQHQQEMAGLRFNDSGQLSRGYIREMIDTSQLQDETIRMIQNYITRNWVFANLKDAQEHDMWYKLDVMQLKILGQHPPDTTPIQGPARAFLLDDPEESVFALTPAERNQIDSFFDTLKMQLTRNREGYEREMLTTQVRESRTSREQREEAESGGLRGLFGR